MPKRSANAANGSSAPKKARVPKSSHKLADPLPAGEVLRDVFKREWKVGQSIGSGGFGLLYLASPAEDGKSVGANAQYVIKCEPHSNGPLFCELHFYQRAAKPDIIDAWMKTHKLKTLGMPQYIGSGSHERQSTKYRFMVMERFSTDLQKLFEKNRRSFPRKTVLMLAIRILNTLEFIHSNDYVHADIKASNLLLGFTKATQNQVYLVDYGLATKYRPDSGHKEYKEDPRKAHDGTIEFTSIDAHKGVAPSRRGDLEILGYCLLQWLCGTLPWESNLNNKDWVRDQKIRYMSDIPKLMKDSFHGKPVPEEITEYLKVVSKLQYQADPDYRKLRGIFETALKKNGWKDNSDLDFTVAGAEGDSSVKPGKKARAASPSKPAAKAKSSKEAIASPKGARKKSPATKRKTLPSNPPAVKSPASARKAKGVTTPKSQKKTQAMSPHTSPRHKALNIPKNVRGPPKTDGAGPSAIKSKKRELKSLSEAGTQTSPGLKGLPRSRKK